MIKRKASAKWLGNGKDGKGTLTTQSSILSDVQYSYKSRFEEGTGTNPEELIGAAHSGCFSMKLAFVLQEHNITPESIETSATVVLDNGAVTEIILETKVKASGLNSEKFQEYANYAKDNCPISKLLNSKISLKADLV